MVVNLAEGVQGFSSNAFLERGDRTVLVDPGSNFDITTRLREHVSTLDAIIITHAHPDHVGNLAAVKGAFEVDAWGFEPEQDGIDHAIADTDRIRIGDHDYLALHTPGHKNDHLCFYAPDPAILFSGDLVFQNGSFGRTDIPEGDREVLIESLDRLLDRVVAPLSALHPGHGPSVADDPYRHIELARQFAEGL